jgi:protein-disulfide isomerase
VNCRAIVCGSLAVAVLVGMALLWFGTPQILAAQSAGGAIPAPGKASTGAKPVKSSTAASSNRAAALSAPQLISVGPITDVDVHKALGSKTAPVIMEVFSDFQCPACKNLYLATNRQTMDNYVSTGKVYLVHRDFPLPMHAHSKVAASYARAAAHIGKVEAVEQALFENQEKWEATGDVDGTVAAVLSAAEMKKVRDLVKGGTLEPLIEKDVVLGKIHNVNQTPTTVFYAKGQTYPYAGQISYEFLKQFLDQLLAQK